MFARIKIVSLLLVFSALIAVYFISVQSRPSDRETYTQMLQERKEIRRGRGLQKQPAHQARKEVQKDIWSMHQNQRTHFQLKSEASDLIIQQKKDKFEATEHLHNLTCTSEEPHTFQAKEGTYFYPTHQFSAEEISLSGTPIRFRSQDMSWNRLKNEIVFSGQVEIKSGDELTAHADEAIVSYEQEFEFDTLLLKGSVHLLSSHIAGKESFALADQLIYKPKDKLFIFTANSPKRVLFWQDDLRLSASQVEVLYDRETGAQSVHGVGEVHFAFDLEEENAIQQFFKEVL